MKLSKGFTLVDSLIALVISSILFSAVLPSFQDIWAKHQSRVLVAELAGLINFARIQAVSKGQSVALCPYVDGISCGKDWSQGVMVFEDPNRDGKIEEEDKVLRVLNNFPNGTQLSWRSFGGKNALRFDPSGTTYLGNGTFSYCPANNNNQYANQIVLNYTGRIRFAADSNNDGIKEDSKGNTLTCGT